MGFVRTEAVTYKGHRCVFLRNGSEHHSLSLLPKALRGELGLNPDTSCASMGVEVGGYQQLRDAVAFLKKHGVPFTDAMPAELYPGVDYAAHILDPAGHCLMLYYYMERIGWDGQAPPARTAPQSRQGLARGARSAIGHLRRPDVHGSTGMRRIPPASPIPPQPTWNARRVSGGTPYTKSSLTREQTKEEGKG